MAATITGYILFSQLVQAPKADKTVAGDIGASTFPSPEKALLLPPTDGDEPVTQTAGLVTRSSSVANMTSMAGDIVHRGLSTKNMVTFLQLGLPGGCMMAADAASFDITTVMAGYLGRLV
jgi:hypothetical protein